MKVVHWIALILVIVGAINWGLWGVFKIDVISMIFGGATAPMARVLYVLIGLAGLWCFYFFRCCCDVCHTHHRKKK